MRDGRDQPLAAQSPAVRAGHVGFRPGLVDEDQAARVNPALAALPALAIAGDVGPTLLGGAQAFLEGEPFVAQEAPRRILAHPGATLSQPRP